MSLDSYEGPGQIQINGRTLAEADSVRFRVIGNNNRVYTMKKGLAGKSDGPREVEIAIENAVPVAGLESDYVEKILSGEYFDVTVVFARKRYVTTCWADDGEISQSSRDAAGFNLTAIGGQPRIL